MDLTRFGGAMQYKLVIFDFDGTLADSKAWFLEIVDEVADRFRFRKIGRDELDELRGQSSREVLRRVGVPIWKLPSIARYVRRMSMKNAHRIPLFPGIGSVLNQLSERKVLIAIASSNAEATVRQVLGKRNAALFSYFECGASMFGKARRIKRILALSGVSPSQAIVVGDETRDLEAARQAGVTGAAVSWGYAKTEALKPFRPTAIFSTVEEMLAFLGTDQPRSKPVAY
jgi:phosphoglycolate phosphatase